MNYNAKWNDRPRKIYVFQPHGNGVGIWEVMVDNYYSGVILYGGGRIEFVPSSEQYPIPEIVLQRILKDVRVATSQ